MDNLCVQGDPFANWEIREDRVYNDQNFWVKIQGRELTIGFTDYGQWSVGDILYLDLSEQGTKICKGEKFGSVESGKWVGNLISPATGVVLEDNPLIITDPRNVNIDPYGMGWMIKMELKSEGEIEDFMRPVEYATWIAEQLKKEDKSR